MTEHSTYKFNGQKLTIKAIEDAKQHFVDNLWAQINGIRTGVVSCNDPEGHAAELARRASVEANAPRGQFARPSVTHLQYAYYAQTGESVALLPMTYIIDNQTIDPDELL